MQADYWLDRVGLVRLRASLPAPPQRRPAQARRARAGARADAEAPADGRALRLARRHRARARRPGRRRHWYRTSVSACCSSPTISKRRSHFPIVSICSRRGRARTSRRNTRCRCRGRATRCGRACIRPSRRSTRSCGTISRAKSTARSAGGGVMSLDPRYAWLRQLLAFVVLLGAVGGGRPRRHAQSAVRADARFTSGTRSMSCSPTAASGRISRRRSRRRSAGWRSASWSASCSASLAALVPLVAELLEPVMTLLNAIPRVILAPLFVIWLGIGLSSKVALSLHPGGGADLLHGVQRHPPGRPQAGRAHHHARRRPLGAGAPRLSAFGRRLDSRQLEGRGGLCLHRRLRRRVRGRHPRPRLSAVVRAEHLQFRADASRWSS